VEGDVVKFASGIAGLFALSMFANAISGDWAFDRSMSGTEWIVLDVVIGVVLAFASYAFWRVAARREDVAALETWETDARGRDSSG
jgi:hypothetical protein